MNKAYIKSQVREWAESIVIAVVIALFIRTFILQAFKIPSGSMIPTFEIGDRIFVNKFLYGARMPFADFRLPAVRQPKRGDIIVFLSPEKPHKDFVKRLIAMEGETVEIKEGKVYVDSKPIDDPPSGKAVCYYNRGDYGAENAPLVVPKESYYVLGDNSASSRDSRYWGFVPKKNLIGKVVFLYWPLHRIRVVK
jgi:signal peptidase I